MFQILAHMDICQFTGFTVLLFFPQIWKVCEESWQKQSQRDDCKMKSLATFYIYTSRLIFSWLLGLLSYDLTSVSFTAHAW